MADKNTQNQAEVYRQQRKERLAKASKQKAKRSPESIRFRKTAGKVIKITLAVVLTFAILGSLLSFFGVPQRTLTVVTAGDKKVSMAEYSYYYMSLYSNYRNTAAQYDSQYGDGYGKMYTGYDYAISPAKQTTTDEDGNTITFADYFRDYVITLIEQNKVYYDAAIAAGTKLSEDSQKLIDDTIDSYREEAINADYSLNRYLSNLISNGMTEKLLREIIKEQLIVEDFRETKSADIADDISEDDIFAQYEENKKDYDTVSLRLYGFPVEEEETEEEAEENEEETDAENAEEETDAENAEEETDAEDVEDETDETEDEPSRAEILANEMLNKITDEESFISLAMEYYEADDKDTYDSDMGTNVRFVDHGTVSSNVNEEAADWLFSTEREIGDKSVFSSDDFFYVMYLTKTAGLNETPPVDVRHILVMFETTQEGEDGETIEIEITDEMKAEYLEKAESIYDEWKSGDKTEESFAELAEEYSDDTYSLSQSGNGEGGMIKGIELGAYVKPFEDWAFDESRKTGDTEIIETVYGYHIMYFVNQEDDPTWKSTIKDSLSTESTSSFFEDLLENTTVEVSERTFLINRAYNKMIKKIESSLVRSTAY